MAEKPMTAEELQRAKDSLANSLPGAFETSANAVNNFSNVFIYDLGLDYYTRYAAAGQRRDRRAGAGVAREVPGARAAGRDRGRRPARIETELQKLNLGAIEIRDAEGSRSKQHG